jgi:hypothetical protein
MLMYGSTQHLMTCHGIARRRQEPTIKEGDLVYLSTKNLSLPKGRANKLMPKYVGPYKVLQADPETSNYMLELPSELVRRRIHPKFHVGLLRPHKPNDDALFPNRVSVDAYDFGTPDNAKCIVDELNGMVRTLSSSCTGTQVKRHGSRWSHARSLQL